MKFFISLESAKLSDKEVGLLKKPEICGVILFGKNILSFETTKILINKIKSIREDILIGIDEEGGVVSRLTHLIPNYSQPYISALPLEDVRSYYKMRSKFLKKLGIDINFAPVVDISLSEDAYMFKRSFGSDTEKVINLSKICISEQKKEGILSCIKHFPGHGRTIENSHEKLPIVNITQEEWDAKELKIFKALIDYKVEYIMVGHLLFPRISNEVSSISKYWVTEILRNKLNFKGKIISDDIRMKGLSESIDTSKLDTFKDVGLDELIISDPKNLILTSLH